MKKTLTMLFLGACLLLAADPPKETPLSKEDAQQLEILTLRDQNVRLQAEKLLGDIQQAKGAIETKVCAGAGIPVNECIVDGKSVKRVEKPAAASAPEKK